MRVLALDLESTLISNAMSKFSRPGLLDFLEWCAKHFDYVCIFSMLLPWKASECLLQIARDAISENRISLVSDLVGMRPISNPLLQEKGSHKDLEMIRQDFADHIWLRKTIPDLKDIWIVDDDENVILPSQRSQWIPIAKWESPYDSSDRELERVRAELEKKIGSANSHS